MFCLGVQTCLSVFPSGIQMEHSSSKNTTSLSALFFYPIKSLVYCGALRYVRHLTSSVPSNHNSWKFVPLDSDVAQMDKNLKNPPLFVAFVKGIDPNTKKQIIECHVFVVGMVKTAMNLVESCQKAFGAAKLSVNEFYKKFGNVPVVYCMKDDLKNTSDGRLVVKSFDINGYFYATDKTPIDLWQLFEETAAAEPAPSLIDSITTNKFSDNDQIYSDIMPKDSRIHSPNARKKKSVIDPYERTENLVKVEKRFDPNTGQNIYVRYLADKSSNNLDNNDVYYRSKSAAPNRKSYDVHELIYSNEYDDEDDFKKREYPPIIIRQEKTPSPIIVEKYIKKKAPQVIIKEIHVQEPAPPPIKVVEKLDDPSIFANEKKFPPIYDQTNLGGPPQQQARPSIVAPTPIMRKNIQYAPPGANNQFTKSPQFGTQTRNMVCHTTYETLQGDTIFPRLSNRLANSVENNTESYSNPADYNYTMPARRAPPLKDINYYLNNPCYTSKVNRYTYQGGKPSNPQPPPPSSHHNNHQHYDDHRSKKPYKERSVPKYGNIF